ncbi:MAG: DDE transposase [Desulfovibrionaceae bacterium]
MTGCWTSAQEWLWFLKLFELNVAAADIAAQLGCSYVTVLKAQDITRRAILAQALDADTLYRRGVWPGPRRPNANEEPDSPMVFGLVEVNDYAICDVLPDLSADDVVHFKLHFHLRTSSVGQVVYTEPCKGYQSLISCGPSLWPTRFISHEDRGIPADASGFWPYAKERLKRLRGVLPAQFPLHLKEWELRYNHRGKELFPVLASALCGLVPDPFHTFQWTPPDKDAHR